MPSPRKGKILWVLGLIYLVTMGIQLVVGLVIAPNHFWFGATLPTVFHLVLAAFVMVYGQFHYQTSLLKGCLSQVKS